MGVKIPSVTGHDVRRNMTHRAEARLVFRTELRSILGVFNARL